MHICQMFELIAKSLEGSRKKLTNEDALLAGTCLEKRRPKAVIYIDSNDGRNANRQFLAVY
jgi:hypothetical protein